jgi:hypothetical protein
MAKPLRIYDCRCHDKPYTLCPLCGCQYCPQTWPTCPRGDWHPSHADNDTERGRRWRLYNLVKCGSSVHRRVSALRSRHVRTPSQPAWQCDAGLVRSSYRPLAMPGV